MKSTIARAADGLYGVRRFLLQQQWFTSTVLPRIPRRLRWRLRQLYFLPADMIDGLLGRREELMPPKSKIFTGSVDDFKRSGQALIGRMVDLGCLTPHSKVLDVGSGMGRLAVALTSYLDANGSYEGFDIVPDGIKWCNENITPKYQNIRFTLADVFNKEYHPTGRLSASEYRFPYRDESFDVVVLTSVFTHMLPPEMEHYVAEVSRVLRSGGCCYATYSLMNRDSREAMELGLSSLRFRRHDGPCWTVDPKVPELAIGYDEDYVRSLYEQYSLSENFNVHYGNWSGRPSLPDPGFSQDIVVATKR